MTNKYSLTYASRIVSLVMAVSLLAGWDLDQGYITELVTSIVWVVGELLTFYGRYRAGGISILGFKK